VESPRPADQQRPTSTNNVAVRPRRSRPSRAHARSTLERTHGRSAVSTVPVGRATRSGSWRSPGALIARVRTDSLLRNGLFIMLTTVVQSAFGFAFWLVAARLFPAHVVGLIAAIISASTIIVLLASLGVGGMLIQSLPTKRLLAAWSVTFWAGMATATAICIAAGCGVLILLPFLTRQLSVLHDSTYALLFIAGTLTMAGGAVLDYVFIAQRAAGNMLLRNTIVAGGKLVMVGLLLVVAGDSALNLLGAWAAASVVGLILGIGLLIRLRRPDRPAPVGVLAREARELLSRMAGNQLIGMGGALLPFVIPVLVTARLSSTDNAYFYTTWMMGGIFLIISPAVSQSLFAEGAHNPGEVYAKARSALGAIGIMLAPCIVGVFVIGGTLLSAFGTAYEHHAIGLLRIVLIASIPDAVTNVYVAVLRVQGRLVAAATLNVAMGLGVIGLSWVFLPTLGISAVGWAFLEMQLCGCVFVVFDLLRLSSPGRLVGRRRQEVAS
jgi:O-antigen/teichoic acid export membrane protein